MNLLYAESFTNFLKSHNKCSDTSVQQYIEHIGKYALFAKQQGIGDILKIRNYPEAHRILCEIKKTGYITSKGHKELSDSYTAKIGYMVSTYWKFAILFNHMEGPNPFQFGCGFKKPQYAPAAYFDSDSTDLQRVLAYPRTVRDKAIIWLLYSSGLRRSEVANLRQNDVLGEEVLVRMGKGRKDRFAPICLQTGRFLASQIENLKANGYEGEWLFPRHDFMGPMKPDTIYKMLRRMAANLGLEKLTPHMMRHTFATRMFEKGAVLPEVQNWLGHEDPKTTMRYTHLTRKHLRGRYKDIVSA